MKIKGLGDIEYLIERGVARSIPALASCISKIRAHVENSSTLESAESGADKIKLPLEKFKEVAFEEMLLSDLFARLETLSDDFSIALADEEKATAWVKLPPKEAIKAFMSKKIMSPRAFGKLTDAYKLKSFTVTADIKVYMIEKIKGDLQAAISAGTTKKAFVKALGERFDAWGVTRLKKHHAETVFDTNVLGSYAHGRFEQLSNPELAKLRPYWQYKTVGDGRVRENHAAMHNKIYPCDSSVWKSWFPPNGFRCRCGVISLTEEQAKEKGVTEGMPTVQPDEGWATSPAAWV